MKNSDVILSKKGDVDDIVENFRDAYYDLVHQTTLLMRNIEQGRQELSKDELIEELSLNIESSLRATLPENVPL